MDVLIQYGTFRANSAIDMFHDQGFLVVFDDSSQTNVDFDFHDFPLGKVHLQYVDRSRLGFRIGAQSPPQDDTAVDEVKAAEISAVGRVGVAGFLGVVCGGGCRGLTTLPRFRGATAGDGSCHSTLNSFQSTPA